MSSFFFGGTLNPRSAHTRGLYVTRYGTLHGDAVSNRYGARGGGFRPGEAVTQAARKSHPNSSVNHQPSLIFVLSRLHSPDFPRSFSPSASRRSGGS